MGIIMNMISVDNRYLEDKVVNWPIYGDLRVYSIYYYYPTRFVTRDEDVWNVRNLVWDFKANPNKPTPIESIIQKHKSAVDRLVPMFSDLLYRTFGESLSSFCLCCIPAKKREVDERRLKDFSEELCRLTGMEDGFSHRAVTEDGEPKHFGGGASGSCSYDYDFFKNKKIMFFDDVITTGNTMSLWSSTFRDFNNNFMCGITIGQTILV